MIGRPDRTEAAEYSFTDIDQVPEGDVLGILEAHQPDTLELLEQVSEQKSFHRYVIHHTGILRERYLPPLARGAA